MTTQAASEAAFSRLRFVLDEPLTILRGGKALAEKAMLQVDDDQLHWRPDDEANSLAIIVRHMAGNMISRWTDFLTTDGEKPWRGRDEEFEPPEESRDDLMARWEEGWAVFFSATESLTEDDLDRVVYIRGEEHTIHQAIQRQLAHYSYHIGQIVQLARQLAGKERWESLSIPRGASKVFDPSANLP